MEVYDVSPVQSRFGVDVLFFAGAGVEVAVVVAGDDDFVFVWEGVEPVEGCLEGFDGPVVGEVAGMEEQVAWGDVGGFVGMCVADADDADGRAVFRRVKGSAAEGDEEGMEKADYDCQWGLEEAFEEGGGIPF